MKAKGGETMPTKEQNGTHVNGRKSFSLNWKDLIQYILILISFVTFYFTEVNSMKVRLAVLESDSKTTAVALSEIKNDIKVIRQDIKKILRRKSNDTRFHIQSLPGMSKTYRTGRGGASHAVQSDIGWNSPFLK